MKNSIILLAIVSLLVFSCKDKDTEIPEKDGTENNGGNDNKEPDGGKEPDGNEDGDKNPDEGIETQITRTVKFSFSIFTDSPVPLTEEGEDMKPQLPEFKTSFAEGDQVGVCIVNGDNIIQANIPFSFTEGKIEGKHQITIIKEKPVKYYAYYPYNAGFNVDDYEVTDPQFMFATVESTTEGEMVEETVDFKLEHQYSIFELDLDEYYSEIATVTLNGITNSLSLSSKEIVESGKGDVDMICVDIAKRIFRALLPSQNFVNNQKIASVKDGNFFEVINATKDLTLEGGKICGLNINKVVEGNLVKNGNFEKGLESWTSLENGGCSIDEDNEALKGCKSVKISADAGHWPGVKQEVVVEGGAKYELKAFGVCTVDNNYLKIDILNDKSPINGTTINFETTSEFKSVQFKIPEGVTKIFVRAVANNASGKVDEISLVKIE